MGIINITPCHIFSIGQYPLLDYTTSFNGSPDNLSIGSAPLGFIYALINNLASSSIDLIVSVPEPGALLSAIALLPLLTNQRRRRKMTT